MENVIKLQQEQVLQTEQKEKRLEKLKSKVKIEAERYFMHQ